LRHHLSGFESAVVAQLLSRAHAADSLMTQIWSRKENVLRALTKLERLGVVRRRGQLYALRRSAFPRKAEIVAIEAKLVRWREALRQAEQYQRFANRSYVAVPVALASNAALLESSRRMGVGVLSVSSARVDVPVEAEHREANSADWVWAVTRTCGLSKSARRSGDHLLAMNV
jgi:hypothetical protein